MPSFTLHRSVPFESYWNGKKPLPDVIHVISPHPVSAEFELLHLLCALHGHVHAYDLITGADTHTAKDKDLIAILTAFQWYLYPRKPLTGYHSTEERIVPRNIQPLPSI